MTSPKDLIAFLKDCDLEDGDWDCLLAHTRGELATLVEDVILDREILAAERDYEDFSDEYRPDPTTGDLVKEEE